MKGEKINHARETVSETTFNVSGEGQRFLGLSTEAEDYKGKLAKHNVDTWCDVVENLSQFAKAVPHTAITAFTFGLNHRWASVIRKMQGMEDCLRSFQDVIANEFLSAPMG